MLLNTLQCTGQPPENTYPAHNVLSAELEKPCSIVRTSDVELANGLMNDREAEGEQSHPLPFPFVPGSLPSGWEEI